MQNCKLMAVAALVVMAAFTSVRADMILTIRCMADDQTSTYDFFIPCKAGDADWTLQEPVNLLGQNEVKLATIRELSLQTNAEPFVNLHFSLEAGSADTTFNVRSALLEFDPLVNPLAYASAGITLTGDADGARITGLLADGMCYQARYNGSSVYENLLPGFDAGSDMTLTQSQRRPTATYDNISGTVSSMQTEFNFVLSALDQASGTSRFEVIPEPTSMSLLALGALSLLRRKRR